MLLVGTATTPTHAANCNLQWKTNPSSQNTVDARDALAIIITIVLEEEEVVVVVAVQEEVEAVQ